MHYDHFCQRQETERWYWLINIFLKDTNMVAKVSELHVQITRFAKSLTRRFFSQLRIVQHICMYPYISTMEVLVDSRMDSVWLDPAFPGERWELVAVDSACSGASPTSTQLVVNSVASSVMVEVYFDRQIASVNIGITELCTDLYNLARLLTRWSVLI